MGGASSQEKEISAQQTQFMNELMGQYQTQFGQNQAIMGQLTKSLSPIINAGVNQQGFNKNELAAMNTQAEQGASQGFRQTQQAVNQEMMSRGGGNNPLTSGADAQINAGIGIQAENNLANQKENIVKANYATGRENYFGAEGALAGVPNAMESPLVGAAGEANGAGKDAFSSADTIHKEGQSWMGLVGGIAGSALGAFNPLSMFKGGGSPSSTNTGSGDFDTDYITSA